MENLKRFTLQRLTLTTLLMIMMARKAETAVHSGVLNNGTCQFYPRVLAARSTVRLSESVAIGKTLSLVCGRLL